MLQTTPELLDSAAQGAGRQDRATDPRTPGAGQRRRPDPRRAAPRRAAGGPAVARDRDEEHRPWRARRLRHPARRRDRRAPAPGVGHRCRRQDHGHHPSPERVRHDRAALRRLRPAGELPDQALRVRQRAGLRAAPDAAGGPRIRPPDRELDRPRPRRSQRRTAVRRGDPQVAAAATISRSSTGRRSMPASSAPCRSSG